MKIDDDGGGSSDGRFNVFGGFMSNDLAHIAVAGAAGERAAEFWDEFVLPAVIDTDADDVNREVTDEGVILSQDAVNDDDALMGEVFLFFDDLGVDAIGAFADDVASRGDEAIVNLVVFWIEADALSFLQEFGDGMGFGSLSEFFVKGQSSIVAVNGHKDVRVDEFDEELEFALISVS